MLSCLYVSHQWCDDTVYISNETCIDMVFISSFFNVTLCIDYRCGECVRFFVHLSMKLMFCLTLKLRDGPPVQEKDEQKTTQTQK